MHPRDSQESSLTLQLKGINSLWSNSAFFMVQLSHPYYMTTGKTIKCLSLSLVQFFVTSWTGAYWAPQTMEFSRHEYCSGKPAPSPRDLPHPGKYHKPPLKSSDLLSTFQGIHQQLLAVLCGRLQSRPNTSFGPRGPQSSWPEPLHLEGR